MEQDLHQQIRASRKGMGDYTRLILAFYACLLLLGVYQQYRLYAEGVLDSFASRNLIILSAHHLGFTALLSLFLYFAFNALEALKPRYGLYFSGIILSGLLFLESGLTAYFLSHYEMPVPGLKVFIAVFSTSWPDLQTVLLLFSLTGLGFYGLYKGSAPMQQWMGRVYPFTLAIFSLFLATMLERAQPLSENKTKYFFGEWFENMLDVKDPEDLYADTSMELDPLVDIYRQETERISGVEQTPGSPFQLPVQSHGTSWNASFMTDQTAQPYKVQFTYTKPERKEWLQIQSAIPGADLDKAFAYARELAHKGEREQAKELCRYILSEVPEYVDAEVLLGRILAWDGAYIQAESVLQRAIAKHPHYSDAYAALLDTYFWAGDPDRSKSLAPLIERNIRDRKILDEKLHRAASTALQLLPKDDEVKIDNPEGS
ncbi:hypothetical protein [Robiginitalea sp.]|uniref:tetratricopeptide repeat protein n=1 Tax=Robiginitalea sp. TaxID=1902411 RepID=UPI003C3869D7